MHTIAFELIQRWLFTRVSGVGYGVWGIGYGVSDLGCRDY